MMQIKTRTVTMKMIKKVSEPTSRIPVFMTGNPFTLNEATAIKLYNSTTDVSNGTTYINFDDRRTTPITWHQIGTGPGNNNTGTDVMKSVNDHRLMVNLVTLPPLLLLRV